MTELELARQELDKAIGSTVGIILREHFERLVRADERAKAMAEQVRALKLAGVIEP